MTERAAGLMIGVHQSFVSRVARGQRNSPEVTAELRYELGVIRDHLNRAAGKSNVM
jgi:hypothetical protein